MRIERNITSSNIATFWIPLLFDGRASSAVFENICHASQRRKAIGRIGDAGVMILHGTGAIIDIKSVEPNAMRDRMGSAIEDCGGIESGSRACSRSAVPFA
jgi:hypothetical protein